MVNLLVPRDLDTAKAKLHDSAVGQTYPDAPLGTLTVRIILHQRGAVGARIEDCKERFSSGNE